MYGQCNICGSFDGLTTIENPNTMSQKIVLWICENCSTYYEQSYEEWLEENQEEEDRNHEDY